MWKFISYLIVFYYKSEIRFIVKQANNRSLKVNWLTFRRIPNASSSPSQVLLTIHICRRKCTSWSAGSSNSATCRRRSANTWPTPSNSRPPRSRSGSRTGGTRTREWDPRIPRPLPPSCPATLHWNPPSSPLATLSPPTSHPLLASLSSLPRTTLLTILFPPSTTPHPSNRNGREFVYPSRLL